jgi:hypothetical protein
MSPVVFFLLVALVMQKRGQPALTPSPATKTGPGTFPTDSTAVQTFPPAVVFTPPAPEGATVPASVVTPPPPAATKVKGIAPGTPEPGFKPYVPTPSAVVSRAVGVLHSGAIRVTEADPTGLFKQVRYRREADPTTGRVAVTAWRNADGTGPANA